MTLLIALALGAGLAYPPAPRGDQVDDYSGRRVPAPYRWMEALDSPQVKQWVEAENALTSSVLEKLPDREPLRRRLTELWDYARTDVPEREAGQLFYRRNAGLQRQSVLYRGPETPILDPNRLFPDGSVAVAEWKVSPDGRWLVYSTAPGGSDLRDLHVRDLRTGKDTKEVVPRVKFSEVSFTRDSRGFFYERYKGTERAAAFAASNEYHQVFYHRLFARGPDALVFERPRNAREGVSAQVSDDGRWLFLASATGTSKNRLWIADLEDPRRPRLDARARVVAPEEDAIHRPLGVANGRLYLLTTHQAPNGRIVSAAIGDPDRAHWITVVPESKDAILEALLVRDRLVVLRLVDVQSRLDLFDLAGDDARPVPLPESGSVRGLSAKNGDPDFFFQFTSYLRPPTVYRFDLASGALTPFMPPTSPFDATRYETRALFYRSRDGTSVPLFVTARKGTRLDGKNPTLLYGYGGFDVAVQPAYSPAVAGWLDAGGVYAVANLRGGGEYGEAWHEAGMREKKQNVFDDFVAAAEYLQREGWTSPAHLAVLGRSNGGLLVAAVANQRPDLFAVALPAVGVMDMLRFQRFTGGAWWVPEYGSSEEPAMVPTLLAYSPLHNVKPGCHPATLVTTADRDDRVVPSHSFQYTAALQAAQTCDKPILIRVETAGSHGYRPTDRIIAEYADVFAFALAFVR